MAKPTILVLQQENVDNSWLTALNQTCASRFSINSTKDEVEALMAFSSLVNTKAFVCAIVYILASRASEEEIEKTFEIARHIRGCENINWPGKILVLTGTTLYMQEELSIEEFRQVPTKFGNPLLFASWVLTVLLENQMWEFNLQAAAESPLLEADKLPKPQIGEYWWVRLTHGSRALQGYVTNINTRGETTISLLGDYIGTTLEPGEFDFIRPAKPEEAEGTVVRDSSAVQASM